MLWTFCGKVCQEFGTIRSKLGSKLVEQFIKIASEILETNGSGHTDKEIQAAGILNTLTTLVISMSNAPTWLYNWNLF